MANENRISDAIESGRAAREVAANAGDAGKVDSLDRAIRTAVRARKGGDSLQMTVAAAGVERITNPFPR